MPFSNHPADLTAVLVGGADARAFMQGQLTSDVRKAGEQNAIWGALCTGQGRVQTILTLAVRGGDLLALLPSALAESVVSRLRAFTLSSKVGFEAQPWSAVPGTEEEARAFACGELPAEPGSCRSRGELTVLRWWGSSVRYLLVGPREQLPLLADDERTLRFRAWHRTDIEAGLPRIFPETQGMFVPQTLNLDLLGGVSFDKGCYVGQEVVARARRGRVPRRLFRFSAVCSRPSPGTVVMLEAHEVGNVVDAVESDAGSELLAVVDLEHAQSRLELRDGAGAVLVPRPLPYQVPLGARP